MVKPGTSFRRVLAQYRRSANEKGMPFELTVDEFRKMAGEPCFWCNAPPGRESKSKGGEVYLHGGVDRVDNSRGYVAGNCVPSCTVCNLMKSAHGAERFLVHVGRIYEHAILNRRGNAS